MTSPFDDLADDRFWNRSVANVPAHQLSPKVPVRFPIDTQTAVVTAGSCFAQHLAREMLRNGLNYLVTEAGEQFCPQERERRNYGLFSARYGNLYTPAHLRQLIEHAFDRRSPAEPAMTRPDGQLVDPVRQQVEPDGFSSLEELLEDRALHLDAVRRAMKEADVLVFTLGLTECWRTRSDQTYLSSPPGVVADTFDSERYEFINFSFEEAWSELRLALERLRAENPKIRVLLTVSPVALVATYEARSVMVSNTVSKATLCAVADRARSAFEWVDYFPSYELITSARTASQYFDPNGRTVNRLGIAHVMRFFHQQYLGVDHRPTGISGPGLFVGATADVLCDEQAIDAVSI